MFEPERAGKPSGSGAGHSQVLALLEHRRHIGLTSNAPTELERDPVGQMQRLYEALDLPDFDRTKLAVEDNVRSIEGYQKNEFTELSSDMRQRVAAEWRIYFEPWGYPIEPCAESSIAAQDDEPEASDSRG